jgi:hypothetical protein
VSLQIVRFTTSQDQVAEVEKGVERVFTAVDAAGPQGMRYLATRVGAGPEFLLMLQLAEGVSNPLPGIPEAAAFQQNLPTWACHAPSPEPLTVLGDYRMLG